MYCKCSAFECRMTRGGRTQTTLRSGDVDTFEDSPVEECPIYQFAMDYDPSG